MILVSRLCASVLLLGATVTAAPSNRERTEIASGWKFQMDPQDLGAKERWYGTKVDRSAWLGVTVPKAWDLYDEALWGYEGIGWYAVSIPDSLVKSGAVQRLKFGRVNFHTKVWLNGEALGENLGGYLPFEFDVSGKLRPGAENLVVLRVDNRYRVEWLPAAREVEWIQYGGPLAPVWLETTSTAYIADLAIDGVPQGAGASVACRIAIRNTGAEREATLRVGIEGQAAADRSMPVKLPAGTSVHNVSLSLDQAKKWSPDSPSLYTLTATLEGLDAVSDRFGVRKVEARGRQILLNGERLIIRGVNRYDEYGKYGPNAPKDLVVEDLRAMKRAGVNFIRVHYPQSPDLLSLYDEMGFMMMEEVPINWWGNDFSGKNGEVQSEGILTQAMPTLEGMIRRDKNHPCLIIWSMANESKTESEVGISVMRKLLLHAKELDKTRLTTFVTSTEDVAAHKAYADADIVAVNIYYGALQGKLAYHESQIDEFARQASVEYLQRAVKAFPTKPMYITEYGNRGVHNIHGDTFYSEDLQAAYIKTVWKVIRSFDELSGGVLWCWADYYHRRHLIQYAVFGPYGVVTVDRQPKAALRALTEMYNGK